MSGTGTEDYYDGRAVEYDQVYAKPERQADLAVLRNDVARALAGKRVLEVAAGTGWWTDVLAETAAGVTAVDANRSTLEVAAAKREWPETVRFVIADAFDLDAVEGDFDAAFVGFFWSHIPLERLGHFVGGLARRLRPGALVVVVDNRYVAGSNHAITRRDGAGNSYQQRRLADGSSWEVRKNFPTAAFLRSTLTPVADEVDVRELDYYWLASWRTQVPESGYGGLVDRPSVGGETPGTDAAPTPTPDAADGRAAGPSEPESWSALASWYDERLLAGSGPHETAVACLLALLPDLTGTEVLDIACGQGLATRALVDAGAARVTGIDSAAPMIDLARQRTDPAAPVRYLVDDATSLTSIPHGAVDGVTCQLGLMDIEDLHATLVAVRRVLRPGGWFTAIIGHPCFLAPHAATIHLDGRASRAVSTYFDEGLWRSSNPQGIRGRAGNYHRSIATYLNALIHAGFVIEEIAEPEATPLLEVQQPVYAQVPIFLGVRATKSAPLLSH